MAAGISALKKSQIIKIDVRELFSLSGTKISEWDGGWSLS